MKKEELMTLYGYNEKREVNWKVITYFDVQREYNKEMTFDEFKKYRDVLNNKITIRNEDSKHRKIPDLIEYDFFNILNTEPNPFEIFEYLVSDVRYFDSEFDIED